MVETDCDGACGCCEALDISSGVVTGEMIAVTTTNEPSPHVKARAKGMKVKTLAFDSYIVTPSEQGKTKRYVHFDRSEQGIVKIECVAVGSGDVCPANSYNMHCSHVEAALNRLLKNIEKLNGNRSKSVSKTVRLKSKGTTKDLPL